MLLAEIKKRIVTAMKEGDAIARDVLRLAQSEIQAAEARKNADLSEDEACGVLRKLIKSNEETLALATSSASGPAERAAELRREIEVLSALLPARLSVDQIVASLEDQHDAIRSAKAEGQAIGVAMKYLKSKGATVDGADVTLAVRKLRS